MQGLILEALTTNSLTLIILFIMTYSRFFFCARTINSENSLHNSVVDASTINAFKALLDKFWSHQAVKYAFTAETAQKL